MIQRTPLMLVTLCILSLFLIPREPFATPYYEGKVVKIVVGSEPGGGYDRMARLVAKYLTKHIPGKPTLIVENMPGAGSIIAANYVYNIAKPDGLTLGAPQRGVPYAQLTKAEGVKFDITKFAWIGSPAVEATIFCVRSDLPYKTFADLQKAKETIHAAGAGPGATDHQYAFLLSEFLGVNLKLVTYTSGSAGLLAIERKEADGKAGSYTSIKRFIDRGVVRALIRGRVTEKGIEGLPVDEDLTPDKKGKAIMAMRSTGDQIGRPFLAPPKTPADVMTILREAFARATKDSEMQEEARKINLDIEYVSSDECLKELNSLFNQPEDIIREFGKYIKF